MTTSETGKDHKIPQVTCRTLQFFFHTFPQSISHLSPTSRKIFVLPTLMAPSTLKPEPFGAPVDTSISTGPFCTTYAWALPGCQNRPPGASGCWSHPLPASLWHLPSVLAERKKLLVELLVVGHLRRFFGTKLASAWKSFGCENSCILQVALHQWSFV